MSSAAAMMEPALANPRDADKTAHENNKLHCRYR
jgi:hypothetical protein